MYKTQRIELVQSLSTGEKESMNSRRILFAGFLFSAFLFAAKNGDARNLDIYFIDVLGGAATLIVTPQGESILIDSGWMTDDHRDAQRIAEAAKKAGLAAIDFSITTHWHRDHFGGIGPLSERMPIRRFFDKGIPEKYPDDPTQFEIQMKEYKKASKGHSEVLRPGDGIPLKQTEGEPPLKLICLAAEGAVVPDTNTTKPNPECAKNVPKKLEPDDNDNSIALRLDYGDFQFFVGGDIRWNIEHRLVCPTNKIGEVDLYMVNHHGFDVSNNPVFLRSLNPRVAVICNGPQKGCSPQTVADLRTLPDLKTLYQLHRNIFSKPEENTAPEWIANPDPKNPGQYIKASVAEDGKSFLVTFGEEGIPKTFACK